VVRNERWPNAPQTRSFRPEQDATSPAFPQPAGPPNRPTYAPRRAGAHMRTASPVATREPCSQSRLRVAVRPAGSSESCTLPYENSDLRVNWMTSARKRTSATPPQTARRADAQRNIETILEAAERCLAVDPDASMSDIAKEAGLGRVTVYGHFKNRAELIEVVARRVLDQANQALAGVDLTGDAAAALTRMVESSWELTLRSGSLIVAAEKVLSPRAIRDAHAGELEARVRTFIERGQRSGTFRSDLSTNWLVAMFHATIHTAANEIAASRLDSNKAAGVIGATLLGAYRPPRETRKRTTLSATKRKKRG
jgi:TetR/AcrR family transcriptional regulator, mexCD-oprJ operon repressor